MSNAIPTIGQKNPEAVVRDLAESAPKLKTLVAVGIYEDGSADIWASQTPEEIEKCSVILSSFAGDQWRPVDE